MEGVPKGVCRALKVFHDSWESSLQPSCFLLVQKQVDLPHKAIQEASIKQKFEDALSLIHSAWQRSDSLCRGRASRDPWC